MDRKWSSQQGDEPVVVVTEVKESLRTGIAGVGGPYTDMLARLQESTRPWVSLAQRWQQVIASCTAPITRYQEAARPWTEMIWRQVEDLRRTYALATQPAIRALQELAEADALVGGLQNRIAAVTRPVAELLSQVLRPGSFWGDVFLVLDREREGKARQEAAERLVRTWFRRPVPPQRWPLVQPFLRERAAAEERPEEQVLGEATVAAVFLALAHLAEEEASVGFAELRAKIANIVCEDLIGPGWRQKQEFREVRLQDDWDWPSSPEEDAAIDETALLREILLQIDLPAAEQRALLARAERLPLSNASQQAIHRFYNSARSQQVYKLLATPA